MGRFAVLVLSLVGLLSLSGCGGKDVVAVQDTFAAWRTAVTAGDGDAAAKLVDRSTLAWWATAARHAANAEQHALEGLDLNMIVAVLRFRHVKIGAELADMPGLAAYSTAVSGRWVQSEGLGGELAEVRVEGDSAVGSLASEPTKVAHRFTRESEGWRVALIGPLNVEASELRTAWEATGDSRGAFALAKAREAVPELSERLLIGPRTE